MNNQTTTSTPEVKLFDGSIKLGGFRNRGEKGDFLSFVPQRSYQEGEEVKYSSSFSGDDLLKLARLCQKAYDEHKAFQSSEYLKRQSTEV